MALRRDDGWEIDSQYNKEQVESVLNGLGVEIREETINDFLCFCPYHGNSRDPAFNVSKTSGKFICFNPACARHGSLVDLVKYLKTEDEFKARRFIMRAGRGNVVSLVDRIKNDMSVSEDFEEYTKIDLAARHAELMNTDYALAYMRDIRGINEDTLKKFQVGYSSRKDMITVPMHDAKGKLIGVIGRSADPDSKKFKNSLNLPKSKTLFNIHRAKAAGAEDLIIVEASFDTMLIDQDGFPNVAAILGGSLSSYHIAQIDRYFTGVVIMTDFDSAEKHQYLNCRHCANRGLNICKGHNPGRKLGRTIQRSLPHKRVRWAAFSDTEIYPNGAKDPGEMTSDQRIQAIKNAIPTFVYDRMGIDDE